MNKLLFLDQHAAGRLPLPLALVAFLTAVFVFVLISPAYGQEEETPTPLAGEEFDTEVMGEPVKVAGPGSQECHCRKLRSGVPSQRPDVLPGLAVRRLVCVAQFG